MAFDLTTQISDIFQTVTVDYVAQTSSDIFKFAGPILGLCLTIAMTIRGVVSIMTDGPPLVDLVQSFLRAGIFISVASVGGIYQDSLADLILSIPDAAAGAVMSLGDGAGGGGVTNVVDNCLDKGIEVVKMAADSMSWDFGGSLSALMVMLLVTASTLTMCGVGFAIFLVSKFMLAILAAFGPVFIVMMCFETTKGIADKWLGLIVNHGTVVVILASVYGLVMSIFFHLVDQINLDSENLFSHVLGTALMAVVGLFVLFETRGIASSIGSGVSVALMASMRNMRTGAQATKGAAQGSAAAGKAAYGAAQTAAGKAGGVARAANDAMGGAAGRVVGAFKGSGR